MQYVNIYMLSVAIVSRLRDFDDGFYLNAREHQKKDEPILLRSARLFFVFDLPFLFSQIQPRRLLSVMKMKIVTMENKVPRVMISPASS